MRAKRCVVMLVGLAVLIPALWAVVHADDKAGGHIPHLTFAAEQRDTLRGLQGVCVVVLELKPELERNGLTRQALQTDTELQLRHYGIRVLTLEECRKTPGQPVLVVNATTTSVIHDAVPVVAVLMEVNFYQQVSLARDPATRCLAETWDRSPVFMVSLARLGELREHIKGIIAEFTNDYLAANPKEDKANTESRTKEEIGVSKQVMGCELSTSSAALLRSQRCPESGTLVPR